VKLLKISDPTTADHVFCAAAAFALLSLCCVVVYLVATFIGTYHQQ